MPNDLPMLPDRRRVRNTQFPTALSPAGGGARAAAREPRAELDWQTYVGSVARHKRLVGVIVALGLVAGVAAAKWLKPVYAARANVWVEIPREGGRNPGPTWSSQLLGATGWIDLLRSDVVVTEAVRVQRLYLLPKSSHDAPALAAFEVRGRYRPGAYRVTVDTTGRVFTLARQDGSVVQRGAVGDSLGAALGFAWRPPATALPAGRVVEFRVLSAYEATQELLRNLEVRPGRDRNFIRVELRGSDPAVITATVNALANRFVEVAADLKRQKLTALTGILGEQLQRAESGLSHAEAALKSFRVRSATLLVQQRDPGASGFLATQVEQAQLRNDRELIERVLSAGDSGTSIHALEVIGSVQRAADLTRALQDLTTREAELRALRHRYTDAYPAVRQLAAEVDGLERMTIPALARGLARDLAAREGRVAQQVDTASQGLRRISPLSVEEARLDREVTVAEQLFMNLRERYEEARLAEMSESPDVRVLDPATEPEQPLYNRAPIAILVALVGSMGAAVAAAVVRDLVDPKLRYPTQVARDLGLTVLGVVPHIDRDKGDDAVQVIEAMRGVRLNVLHAYGSAGPLLVTVTSPGMGDGKSFITSNLALAFADARYRTLLVDGDIRRGALHRVLKVARKPGLTDLLAGDVPEEKVIQKTAFPELSFIGCGARRHGGPELLGSATMARFITSLRAQYDVILVDSSPLAAGVDPYALGTLTGNLLLVLRTGVTDRQLAEAKLDVMDRLPIRVLGTVVNAVRADSDYRRYSYYLAGYELSEEGAATGRVLQGPAKPGGGPAKPGGAAKA